MPHRKTLLVAFAGLALSQMQCVMLEGKKTQPKLGQDLFVAAEANDLAKVRQLLAAGANVNARGDQGLTPLHCAAYHNNLEMAKLLLSKGGDVNARSYTGKSPLYFATDDEVRALLKKHGGK